MVYGVSKYSYKHQNTSEKYILFRDRDGKNVKIAGENLLFDFKNQNMIDVSYIGVKTGRGGIYDASLKDGGRYNVEWGYIEFTDKNGEKKVIKSLEFDVDGDGIADTRYKISDLQVGKVKAKKIKHDSEYFNKRAKDIFSENNSRKRERRLEKLKSQMQEAGISENIIAAKLGSKITPINLSAPLDNVNYQEKYLLSDSILPQISPEEVANKKNEKIKALMQKYNEAVKDRDIEAANLVIDELSAMNLSDENKAMIEEMSSVRSPLAAINLKEADNEYERTLANTDFAKLDKTVASLKHLRNYEQIVAQYESIKADAIRKGYYKIN